MRRVKTRACILFWLLQGMVFPAAGGDPATPKALFSAEPLKLRAYEVNHLFVGAVTSSSFQVSAESERKKLDADWSRFKAMNGRDLIELTPKVEPPSRLFRLLNAALPSGGLFGTNPNAPPTLFTR